VAKALYQLNLDIRFAKIAAHLDQVVVVFYVTDAAGVKIDDLVRLDEIKRTLLESIRTLDAGDVGATPR